MWGVTWDSVIDQSSKWEATFFIFTPGLLVFRFLIVLIFIIFVCFIQQSKGLLMSPQYKSCVAVSLVWSSSLSSKKPLYRHTNKILHLKNYNFTRTIQLN